MKESEKYKVEKGHGWICILIAMLLLVCVAAGVNGCTARTYRNVGRVIEGMGRDIVSSMDGMNRQYHEDYGNPERQEFRRPAYNRPPQTLAPANSPNGYIRPRITE